MFKLSFTNLIKINCIRTTLIATFASLKSLLLVIFCVFLISAPHAYAEAIKLETVLQQATKFNSTLIEIDLNQKASQAFIDQSNVSPNPQLSFFIIPTDKKNPYFRQTDRQVRIDQLIERGQKRELRTEIATALNQSIQINNQAVTRQVLTEATGLWIELKRAQAKLELAKQQIADAQKLAQSAQVRLKSGDISKLEYERIRIDTHRTEDEAKQTELNLKQAQLALAIHIGAQPTVAAKWWVQEAWENLSPTINIQALNELSNTDALSNLPEIKAAKQGIDLAEKKLYLARSQRNRDLTISAQLENQPNQGGSVVGLGVSIPLLIGNNYRGDILRAEVEIQQAHAQWMALLKQLQSQTAQLILKHAQLQERSTIIVTDLLASAQKSAQKVTLAYQTGIASLTDLLDAKRQAYQAQSEAIDVQADLAITRFTLEKLLTQAGLSTE